MIYALQLVSLGLKPGMIMMFPEGDWDSYDTHATCNGGTVSRSHYPRLFSIIGTKFGEGDGETTFNLPNIPCPIEGMEYVMFLGISKEEGALESRARQLFEEADAKKE
jgi:microcystin-dependent protein